MDELKQNNQPVDSDNGKFAPPQPVSSSMDIKKTAKKPYSYKSKAKPTWDKAYKQYPSISWGQKNGQYYEYDKDGNETPITEERYKEIDDYNFKNKMARNKMMGIPGNFGRENYESADGLPAGYHYNQDGDVVWDEMGIVDLDFPNRKIADIQKKFREQNAPYYNYKKNEHSHRPSLIDIEKLNELFDVK